MGAGEEWMEEAQGEQDLWRGIRGWQSEGIERRNL